MTGRLDKMRTMEIVKMMTRCVDDCGNRIPSLLRGSVVVILTSEDSLMYIIIVYCCTPTRDVCSSFGDAIIVYGH